jgi:hypothetical protein
MSHALEVVLFVSFIFTGACGRIRFDPLDDALGSSDTAMTCPFVVCLTHESGSFSEYDASLGQLTSGFSVTTAAALHGTSYGAQIDLPTPAASYGVVPLPPFPDASIWLRFYLRSEAISTSGFTTVLELYVDGSAPPESDNPPPGLSIQVTFQAGVPYLGMTTCYDLGGGNYGCTGGYDPTAVLSPGEHLVELQWGRAPDIASNATGALYIDSTHIANAVGGNNFTSFPSISRLAVGAVSDYLSAVTGTIAIDEIVVSYDVRPGG